MTASFVTYIDESGCDGFRFNKGSSNWLILAAGVFRKNREPSDVRVVDEVRAALNKSPKKDLHFSHLNHKQRLVYVTKLRQCHLRAIYVAIHKPSLADSGTFQVTNRLYHYIARLLIERVSWLCAAHRIKNEGDGRTELIFSHRRTLSYEAVRDYFRRLKTQGTEIDWDVIDPDCVQAVTHKERKGLWIADCLASSFYHGLEFNEHGLTEGRYADELGPIGWHQNKNYAGAGVKIYPKEALSCLDLDGQHLWLSRTYGISAK